jgi:plexin A
MPLILNDIDGTSKSLPIGSDGRTEARCLNMLRHYGLRDGAVVALVSKQSTLSSTYSSTLNSHNGQSRSLRDTLLKPAGGTSATLHAQRHLYTPGVSTTDDCYHLVRSHDVDLHRGERGSKMVSEIYLTRLLATKGTLQQYVDDLFETIFSIASRGSVLPSAIKYMFDFLDDQAIHHGLLDTEIVHTWKSNSLPLRFWVNVIKNPDFVFDIHKSNIVDSCLSVVAQTFMDSCSMSEQKLGKDSPSSKLLYAKDIPKYKSWVERYYEDIQKMPAINELDMCSLLKEESMNHVVGEFETKAAVHELYKLLLAHNDDLMRTLEEDEFAIEHRLAFRLSQVHSAMNVTV